MNDPTHLIHSPASRQWKKIAITPHHGIAIPLFSIHSSTSYGIGEYPDLHLLIDWCRSIGFSVIQLLPLNDCGLGSSPYSALSAFALNPIYIGLSSLPHVMESPLLKDELKILPKMSFVQRVEYAKVRELKEKFLRHYYKYCGPQIIKSESYQQFVDNATWLKGFAAFKILKERHRWSTWETWPEEERVPSEEFLNHLISEEEDEFNWHCFLQYLCDEQLSASKKYANERDVLLMGDIPILIDRESADVWQYQHYFDLNFSAGAPPDNYSQDGQKWGFPIYNWQELEKTNYRWWIDRLQWSSRYYHLYRIDHIVGFFRIWAIPLELTAKEGHYIPQDEATWIDHGQRILMMMLNNCEMLPIGEDLGTVPPEVKTCLNALGICGTKMMRWERRWNIDGQFIPPQDYLFASMSTVSTHDSETLQHWWKSYPLEAQLLAYSKGWSYQSQLSHAHHQEILWDSHHSNSLFHINLLQEYLALIPGLSWSVPEDDRINVPGIISDHNWTYRLRIPLEDMMINTSLNHLMKDLIT